MKIKVMHEFDSMDELLAFYNHLRNDIPTDDQIMQTLIDQTNDMIEEHRAQVQEQPEPKPEPKPEPELQKAMEAIPPKQTAAPIPDRSEVKKYCSTARTEKGIDIKALLKTFGVTSFSTLPDDKLGAFYDAVKSACGD